jgi:hypothetical protein
MNTAGALAGVLAPAVAGSFVKIAGSFQQALLIGSCEDVQICSGAYRKTPIRKREYSVTRQALSGSIPARNSNNP